MESRLGLWRIDFYEKPVRFWRIDFYDKPVRVLVSMASFIQMIVINQFAAFLGKLKKCFHATASTNLLINLRNKPKLAVKPVENRLPGYW